MSRKPLVAGNWKMNGDPALVSGFASAMRGLLSGGQVTEILLCPPAPLLQPLSKAFAGTPLMVGAQNVSEYRSGAYTGEVSGGLLAAMGITHVIVGHSERRAVFGETSQVVAAKARQATDQRLIVLVCLGETLDERNAGRTFEVLSAQLDPVLDVVPVADWPRLVLAYEPVWAIGTGLTATPEQAQEAHAFLRSQIAERDAAIAAGMRIIYGGSVKAANAAALFACPDIDGGLVGGSSLDALEFMAICRAVATGKD